MNIKVIQKKSPNFDKRPQGIKINSIIIHYTGMKTFNQAYKRLCDKKSKVSSHYLIGRDGKIINLVERKKKDQPSKIKTCGSTFKNHENNKAWSLIKKSGCASMKVGDAHISEKHCNFFVNKGNAKSQDLENLIYQVKNKVLDKTGIKLELELEIIGEKL